MSLSLVVFSGVCALVTWCLSHAYRRLALRADIIAHPNHRSAHHQPTPTGAGIVFIGVWTIAMVLAAGGIAAVDPLWLGPLAAAIVGFIDDRRELPWTARAAVYALACAWSIAWVGFPTLNVGGIVLDAGWFGLAFGFVSLLWLLNLYNFMDGIDGLAVGEAIFVLAGAMVIAGVGDPKLLLLLGVCLGFAVINWPRAKVFMGDAGAGFLGLTLGVFALAEVLVSVWVWVILLGYFLTDACLTILIRFIRGERIYESHNLHAFQHLTRRFGGPRVLHGVLALNVVWLLPIALLAHHSPDNAVYLVIFAFIPLLVCQFLCGAGQTEPGLEFVKSRGNREATF